MANKACGNVHGHIMAQGDMICVSVPSLIRSVCAIYCDGSSCQTKLANLFDE